MVHQVIESVIGKFPDKYREMFEGISSVQEFEKDVFILEQGKLCKHLWFINKGAVKVFESIKDGERVIYLFLNNIFFTNYYWWFTSNPSDIAFKTVEKSEIIVIDYPKLEILCSKHHIFDTIGRKMAERIFVEEFQLRKLLLNCTATERYEYLENHRPEIFQRFALKDIASFIGITDVSLSRIRKDRIRK